MEKKKLKKYAIVLLKLVVSVSALIYVFYKIPFGEVWQVAKTSKLIFLALALLFFILSKIVAAYRLQYFFQKVDVHISDHINLKLYLLGMFYNLFLPGGIGGDGYKIYRITKGSDTKGKKVFGAVLTDRVSGISALGILASLMIPAIYNPWFPSIYALVLVPMIFTSLYFFIKILYPYFISILGVTSIYSIVVQLAQLFSAYCILQALGIQDYLYVYLVLFLISSIVTILPISFGGIGLREITFTFMATAFPIQEEYAVAFALTFYVLTLITSSFGIVFHFKGIELDNN